MYDLLSIVRDAINIYGRETVLMYVVDVTIVVVQSRLSA
jgi:hypothetical protein